MAAGLGDLSFVVLDLETQRLAREVEGEWNNPGGFGLTVACTWDKVAGFCDWYEADVQRLVDHLGNFPRVVGFNILGFDYGVLNRYCSTSHLHERTLDILEKVKAQLSHRVRLEDLAKSTLGRSKSASGEQAVKWWRQGEKDKVVSYCRDDVEITRDLFLYGVRYGYLKYPRYGEVVTVQLQIV